MKLVKKTAEYSIYQRRDNRYAVQDAGKNPVNAEEKVRILAAEGLVSAPPPREPEVEEPAAEEAAAEAAEESAAEGEAEAESGSEAEAGEEEK
jgi:hypothetical protein